MKFGKEFSSQMVQEWQQAYMNYNQLKGILKDVSNVRRKNKPPPKESSSKKQSVYRAFSGLTSRYTSFKGGFSNAKEKEDEVILVNAGHTEVEEGIDGVSKYETIFLRSSEEGGEYELVFFRRLDDEFNKVVKFYKVKVEEMVKEAEELNKQMDALIALRFNIYYPDATDSSPLMISRSLKSMKMRGAARLDAIQETEMSEEGSFNDNMRSDESDPKRKSVFGPSDLLNHVKINVAHHWHGSNSYNKKELSEVEEQLKQAFIVFHQKLCLLKSYCFLNQLAFSKIMKKYDKITSRSASKAYLEMVDNSCLGLSEEVAKLIDRVEATYIKHLSNGNRHKGMSSLRPKPKRERHRTTFFLGLLSGCCLALIVTIGLTIRVKDIINSKEERTQYMKIIFPLYTLYGFIVLHMIMYSANIYFWNRFRVNYSFIFGFKPGTEMGYRDVLLVASGLGLLTLAAVLSSLEIDLDKNANNDTGTFIIERELVPLILVAVVLVITFCPFNIVYRTNRFFILVCLWHCICAPFYKVTLPDFFLGDQLTSQVQSLRSLQFYVCYYLTGDFTKDSNMCSTDKVYKIVSIIVAVIPYWIRCLQCLRRLYEERDPMQGLNGLKYFSTIAAVIFRTLKDQRKDMKVAANRRSRVPLMILAASTSGVATVFNTYWDLVIDWGLLNKDSNNPWLRDKLLVPNKFVYFGAMILNVLLRLAWMQTVLGVYDAPFIHENAMIAIFAVLEILRRGLWNFFRLENEHLNNVGKYRAFKSVPLPFSYEDEDKDQ